MEDKIRISLKKVKEYLIKNRGKDGLWYIPKKTYNLPAQYQNPLIKSLHAVRSLITLLPILNLEEQREVKESLFEIFRYPIPEDSPIDFYVIKLLACAFSNTAYANSLRKNYLRKINQLGKNGFWDGYKNTYHFTNFFIADAFQQNNIPLPSFFIKEILKRYSKERGWKVKKEGKIEASPTVTMLLSSLFAGLSPSDSVINTSIKKLQYLQRKDGGWTASLVTEPNNSVCDTTALILLLILLTTGDTNKMSVTKALKFLLKNQNKDGSWPFSVKDRSAHLFTQFYVTHALSFYLFFKEESSKDNYLIKKDIKPAHYPLFIYKKFINNIKEKFITSQLKNLYFTAALGSTKESRNRRKDILNIFSEKMLLDEAEIIDLLKSRKPKIYEYLKKKSHITLIKNDLRHLEELQIIHKHRHKYFIVIV